MRASPWVAALAMLAAAPAHGQANGMSSVIDSQPLDRDATDVGKAMKALDGRHASPEQQAKERLAYQENLRVRRAEAEQYAAAARNGVPLPADAAASLRHELEADIDQWREEFRVNRKEWQAMRDRWLVDRDSLTAMQWAQRRVDWWTARDAWVAAHHS